MKTSVYIGTSLDGFIARSNGEIDWLTKFEDSVREQYAAFIRTIDAIVIGRGTFETVLTYASWPYDKKVYVLSNTLRHPPDGISGDVTVLSMKPAELLKDLSARGHAHVYVDGGKVIQGFLRDDCIDEMIITRAPVILGSGIPLFSSVEKVIHWEHLHTKSFPNGLVSSHYRRAGR
ncbi:MAG TPA: dihydrofolate reductase family protein [Bacteroidota bacterium]|nr:dihydrofolate reductase family protein [Bacteroidota bacterium]